jgi:hypothetical protein
MKTATLLFNSPATRRTYQDALRARMYLAGYEPHYVTEYIRLRFVPSKLIAFISGTDDAERAADVANEVRGVMVKMSDEAAAPDGQHEARFVAVDPKTGLHLREATKAERAKYLQQPGPRAFRKPVRVGKVLVDEDTGPGAWHGGAGF